MSEDFGDPDEDDSDDDATVESATGATPEELKLREEEKAERAEYVAFVNCETRKARDENNRRHAVRTAVARRCPNEHDREPAVLASMAFARHERDVARMLRRCEASEAAFASAYAWYDDFHAH